MILGACCVLHNMILTYEVMEEEVDIDPDPYENMPQQEFNEMNLRERGELKRNNIANNL